MKIGIDISQIVHEHTGVAVYVRNIVRALIMAYPEHEYVLFGASLRKQKIFFEYAQQFSKNTTLKSFYIPPTLLHILWNKLHILPIEWFIGAIDIFWSSDWTQPPLSQAACVTTVHDVSFMHFPHTFAQKIIDVQKQRLEIVKRECRMIFCDSVATKKDIIQLLGIPSQKLRVVYPGL